MDVVLVNKMTAQLFAQIVVIALYHLLAAVNKDIANTKRIVIIQSATVVQGLQWW